MVCVTALPCMIKFNLHIGAKAKKLSNIEFLLNASTRGEDLYDYIQERGQIPPDSFKLYLLSAETVIDLSENKDKTMSEIGVDFSVHRGSTKCKLTLLVVDPTSTSTSFSTNSLVQEQIECNLPTYNPPPPSPNHSSVRNEDDVEPEICYVGLVNQAMTCYLNSLLQALYMTPEFRNALYNWEYVEGSEKDEANSIPYQLQKLFLILQTSTRSAVETTALTKSFGWDSTEAWQQHDIQELCRVMFDALEQKFKNTEQADLINRLYEGKMIDYVKCLECSTEKSREDTFLDIPLPVRPFGSNVTYSSVEEALRAFVQYETLEGNNQYFCEKCNKKCDAHKGLKFTKFPYLLTLHLKRFDFDFKTFNRIKLNDKVTFPDILNLNSFIPSTPNQESPSSDENIGLVKCDDSSTTDSGTLDDDYVLCENNLSNSNHSTNHDRNDDEGIDMSNGPSTSNSTVHNHENEKNRNSSTAAKGPYNYELFSIMIHSGCASGGHYYAYIKDFKTQEWFRFNDQSVTQITHDDIQKTYGGGPNRPYHRVSNRCANAYMLMYRQIDPARNALPMQVQDFPKHIQEVLKKIENDDKDRENCISQHTIQMSLHTSYPSSASARRAQLGVCAASSIRKVKVHYLCPNQTTPLIHRIPLPPDATWAETTKQVYKNFHLEQKVDLDQCRLVAYDEYSHKIVASYEGRENETFGSIWNNRMGSLLLEIRDKDQKFESYSKGIITKVFIVDVPTRELVEGPIIVRASLTKTVKEYKQMVGNKLGMDLSEMEVVFRKYGADPELVPNNDIDLRAAGFCNLVNVFMSSIPETEYKPLFNTTICGIVEELENVMMLRIKLPYTSKEALEELNIPPLEEEPKEKEKAVSTSPSKVSVNESNHDTGPKSNEVTKTGKSTEDAPVRNSSPQLGEGEEWNTPEQSNSEDSSLSDSDKTLVGDAPEDDVFQSSYISSKNRAIKMQNQGGLENLEDLMDDTQYYFKATPYTNTYQKFLKVLVDKRMTFSNIKNHLAPYIGVRPEYFKIFRYFDESSGFECSLFSQVGAYENNEKFCIKLERTLRNGEFTVKLYQFFIDSPEPYKFLGELVLSEDMQVSQAKKHILAEIKRKYDIDIPYERCRLRNKLFSRASTVFLDDFTFMLPFYSQIEMIIQELPDKESITNSNQIALFVRRWSVEKMQLGPLQEIVLDEKSIKDLHKKLSSISDIPEKHIEVATAKGSLSYTPVFQNELDWNESITEIVLSIEHGALFLYRDNRETVSNLTREVFSEIPIQEASRLLPSSSASRYSVRKEKALKINLDAE